jgi:hypothetical protein
MNKLFFRLKYGNFPDCIVNGKDEVLQFAIYNFLWDIISHHHTVYEHLPEYIDPDVAFFMNNVSMLEKEVRYLIDEANISLKKVEQLFYKWIIISEEMYG